MSVYCTMSSTLYDVPVLYDVRVQCPCTVVRVLLCPVLYYVRVMYYVRLQYHAGVLYNVRVMYYAHVLYYVRLL